MAGDVPFPLTLRDATARGSNAPGAFRFDGVEAGLPPSVIDVPRPASRIPAEAREGGYPAENRREEDWHLIDLGGACNSNKGSYADQLAMGRWARVEKASPCYHARRGFFHARVRR